MIDTRAIAGAGAIPNRMPRSRGTLVRPLLACVLFGASLAAAQPAIPEFRLKAAFLVKFAQFVEWPAGVFEGRSDVDVCVMRPSPFGTELHDAVKGETLRGLPLSVREVTRESQAETCHLLFLADVENVRARAILRDLADRPVLTVSDQPTFGRAGGMITLHLVEGRVRFAVNLPRAERAGLRLSSQLLRLATNVEGAVP
jgi:hypothetical protein